MATNWMTTGFVTLALALATAAAGCDGRPVGTTEPTPRSGTGADLDTTPPPPENETAATLSPIEVVNVTTVLDQAEVARGEMARQRAVNAEVRQYADRMVAEYTRSRERVQVITEPSVPRDPMAQLRQRHQRLVTQDLEAQSGASFDAAYIAAQVAAHAEELALIDRSLLPSIAAASDGTGAAAPAPGLRAALQEMRPMVAAHLVEALQIEQRLRQSPAAPSITPN